MDEKTRMGWGNKHSELIKVKRETSEEQNTSSSKIETKKSEKLCLPPVRLCIRYNGFWHLERLPHHQEEWWKTISYRYPKNNKWGTRNDCRNTTKSGKEMQKSVKGSWTNLVQVLYILSEFCVSAILYCSFWTHSVLWVSETQCAKNPSRDWKIESIVCSTTQLYNDQTDSVSRGIFGQIPQADIPFRSLHQP